MNYLFKGMFVGNVVGYDRCAAFRLDEMFANLVSS